MSIDGGNVSGATLPLSVLDYIETETYRVAAEKGYLTQQSDQYKALSKLPISSLFDTITSTSIGGLIAAGLTVPD